MYLSQNETFSLNFKGMLWSDFKEKIQSKGLESESLMPDQECAGCLENVFGFLHWRLS